MQRPQLACFCLLAVFSFALARDLTAAQGRPGAADPEVEQVERMLEQAQKEIGEFRRQGGKADDPANPGRRWAATLWEYREQHLGTAAAARATSESVHFLIHAARVEEALARMDALTADDGAWDRLANVLLEAADIQKDPDVFIRRAETLLPQWTQAEWKAQWGFALGQSYWSRGDAEKAMAALRAVMEAAPESAHARKAPAALEEIGRLKGYGKVLTVGERSWRARDLRERPTEVMERLRIAPGSAVADVGSGEGYFTFLLAARVGPQGKVYAVDIEEKPLQRLQTWAGEQNLRQIETIHSTPKDPRLPAASVDAILVVDTYHEMRDYKEMLKAMFRALRPGGRMGVIERTDALNRKRRDYHERHSIPVEVVVEEAAPAGFRLMHFDAGFSGLPKSTPSYLAIFEKPGP